MRTPGLVTVAGWDVVVGMQLVSLDPRRARNGAVVSGIDGSHVVLRDPVTHRDRVIALHYLSDRYKPAEAPCPPGA